MARRAAPHRGLDVHCGDLQSAPNAPQPDGAADADPDAQAAEARPSKTQRKQQAHGLQSLGLALSELSPQRLEAIEMPEPLRDAIVQYRRTRSHEGRRRQLQYVGKLMHNADEAALREAVAEATIGSAQSTLALHQAEHWRAELIADDDAMTRWLHDHPSTDAQQLRSLVRQARRDGAGLAAEARQPKSHRELFQLIRPILAKD
ncbi:MAG: ribosome biogenesis factor YjgA [Rubrivivax sp.]